MAFLAHRREDNPAPPAAPTPAELAERVRVPASLQMALRQWRELQRRHGELTARLRELVATVAPIGEAPARSREITAVGGEIDELRARVRDALAVVREARGPHAKAVAEALRPSQAEAGRAALTAAEQLAAALARLDEIDRELLVAGATPWNVRPLRLALGPLRHRLQGLLA